MALSEKELFTIVGPKTKKTEVLSSKPYSYWKSVWTKLISNKVFIICLILLVVIILYSIFGFLNNVAVPMTQGTRFRPKGDPAQPGFISVDGNSYLYIYGLGMNGEDFWVSTWIGTKWTLLFSFTLSFLQIILGVIIGLIWGYFRKLDIWFIQIINIITIVPTLILILIVLSVMPITGFWPLILAILIQAWVGLAMTTRVQTLFVLNSDYNVASKMLGTPSFRIITRNILPKILPVIVQAASFALPTGVSLDATFSYLNYGYVDGSIRTSLGKILSEVLAGTSYMVYPMLIVVPIFMISLTAFLFFIVCKILADSLNPKGHR